MKAERPYGTQLAMVTRITEEWAAKGQAIEGGWHAFVVVGGLEHAPAQQLREMRKAYMLGAQHVFAVLAGSLDPGSETTDEDLRRVSAMHAELEAFRRSLGD